MDTTFLLLELVYVLLIFADDFKPLSVDNSKPGKLRVGEGDEVNMSLPVVQVNYNMKRSTQYSVLIIGASNTL